MKETLLFTGASGFLGTNVRPLLAEQYDVRTVGISDTDNYLCNLAKEIPQLDERPDVVLHAAGKAHMVPRTEEEKQLFFDINYQGTIHLCQALERVGAPRALVFISTVAVYGCDFGENITEDHPLQGETPYALSKRQAEAYLTDWCKRHQVTLGILRPSLLAGPNPPGNLGAMIAGIRSGRYLSIAGGRARKSVLMVQDIARLVPLLAQKGGVFNVCDSDQPSFGDLERLIAHQLGKKAPLGIPYWAAKSLALVGDCLGPKAPINSLRLRKITDSLTFSNEKAVRELGWTPLRVLDHFKIA